MAAPEQRQVPIVWVGVEELPVVLSNQMVIQHSAEDEFVLTFGQLTPPVLLGTPEQRAEQARVLTYVAVKPVARVGFNRQRLQELVRVLQDNLAKHDEAYERE